MKRLFYLSAIAIIASCSQLDPPTNDFPDHTFKCVVKATNPGFASDDVDTRVTLSYVIRMNWKVGDEISVINATTRKALGGSLKADASGSTTTFSGSLTGTVKSGDQLVFIYPSQNYTSEQSFSAIDIDFSSQTGGSPESVPYVGTATAKATSDSFSSFALNFSYQMSFFQLNVADLPSERSIDYIKLVGMDNNMHLDLGLSKFVASHTTTSDCITLSPDVMTTSGGGKILFFTVPPQYSVSTERSIIAKVGGEEYSMSFTKGSVTAGSAYRTYALNFGGYKSPDERPVDPAASKETETYPGGEFGE